MTNESNKVDLWIAPDVPTLYIFNDFLIFLIVFVSKSMFTSASNSFTTISILSVPIPVEITVIF